MPAYDYTPYTWHPSPTDPTGKLQIRQAAGGEILQELWSQVNGSEHKLVVALTVSLSDTPKIKNEEGLIDAARKAWIRLRYDIPTIACQTITDPETGKYFMTYKSISDGKEVEEWAKESFVVEKEEKDIFKLRYRVGDMIVPDPKTGNQTWLYFVPLSSEPLSFHVLFFTHHTPFDGNGAKMIMTDYLEILAGILDGKKEDVEWGTETKNLAPVLYHILGEAEADDGPGYMQTLGGVMGDLQKNPLAHGFKHRGKEGRGTTARIGFDFDLEESQKLLKAVKKERQDFTITHVAHAAMNLVVAEDNPPTQSDIDAGKIFFTYGLFNGRLRLRPPYNVDRKGYTGFCLALSPIIHPIDPVLINVDGNNFDDRGKLVRLTNLVCEEYKKQKAYPGLLAIGAQEVDLIVGGIKEQVVEAMKAGVAFVPPPQFAPWFAGDGIGERYIQPIYTSSVSGEKILEVKDFFVSVNRHEPGPLFRVASWAGRLKISIDYNEVTMPKENVDKFMESWVRKIRLIAAE